MALHRLSATEKLALNSRQGERTAAARYSAQQLSSPRLRGATPIDTDRAFKRGDQVCLHSNLIVGFFSLDFWAILTSQSVSLAIEFQTVQDSFLAFKKKKKKLIPNTCAAPQVPIIYYIYLMYVHVRGTGFWRWSILINRIINRRFLWFFLISRTTLLKPRSMYRVLLFHIKPPS